MLTIIVLCNTLTLLFTTCCPYSPLFILPQDLFNPPGPPAPDLGAPLNNTHHPCRRPAPDGLGPVFLWSVGT